VGPARRLRRARLDAGFSVVEVMVAGFLLVLGALGFASSVCTSHVLATAVTERGQACETLHRLVERLRADPDWNDLYARLKLLTEESAGDGALAWRKVDLSLRTHPLTTYYADLVPPTTLGTVSALVQVPASDVDGVATLRESQAAPRYGLPADLDGDGRVDGDDRAADYRTLPVVVRLRWQRPPRAANEIVLSTWLRGDR
jgi:Tfp pilus assembly protein PilV